MMILNSNWSRFLSLYCSSAVFLFLALTLAIRGGFSYGIMMLWLGGLAMFFVNTRPSLDSSDYLILGAFFFYFAIHYLLNLYHHDILREYDLPLRFMLAIPVLFFLRKNPPSDSAFWGGVAIGTLSGGLLMTWQFVFLTKFGEFGRMSQNLGNLAVVMSLICFSGWRWALSREKRIAWLFFLFLAAVSGLVGSFCTGTRGAWLVLPGALFILLVDSALYFRWSATKIILLASSGLVLLLFVASHPIVKIRLDAAVKETKLIFASEYDSGVKIADTSLGQRWLMWSNAIHMIKIKPWFGWGKTGYLDYKNQRILNGEVLPQIAKYTDAHDDYIDALAKRGVIGLLSLMALFITPLVLFFRRSTRLSSEKRSYSLAGILMIAGYMTSGLTCTFMTINMDIMFYSVMILVLWNFMADSKLETDPCSIGT